MELINNTPDIVWIISFVILFFMILDFVLKIIIATYKRILFGKLLKKYGEILKKYDMFTEYLEIEK